MAQITKHLALNVPVDFDAHVQHAMASITSENRGFRGQELPSDFFVKRYVRSLTAAIMDADCHPDIEHVAADLSDVEARFTALLNTIDQSVNVSPLFKKYSRISRSLKTPPTHPTNRSRHRYRRTLHSQCSWFRNTIRNSILYRSLSECQNTCRKSIDCQTLDR